MTTRRAAAKKATAAKRTTSKRAGARGSSTKPPADEHEPAVEETEPVEESRETSEPGDGPGPTELAVAAELEALHLTGTALGTSALRLARFVDEAASGSEAAVSARELRMTLAAARTVGNLLSPLPRPGSDGDEDDEGSGTVVGADRLEEARRRSADARKGKRPARRKTSAR